MGGLQQIADKLAAIDMEGIALKVARSEIHVAIDLNTEAQLFERGINAEGESLGEYAPSTIAYKKARGQRYDHVTLHDEEDFVGGFFARTEKFPITFGSRDSKAPMLESQYGGTFGIKNDLYGLTDENESIFAEHTAPYIAEAGAQAIREAFQ